MSLQEMLERAKAQGQAAQARIDARKRDGTSATASDPPWIWTDHGVECRLCGDTGVANGDLCACRSERKIAQRLYNAGNLALINRCTMGNYRADEPWQRSLLGSAQDFIVQDAHRWFFIGGQSGAGKTHLCTAIFSALAKKRTPNCWYFRWADEGAKIKALANDPEQEGYFMRYEGCDLLYIDDLFKKRPTDADLNMAYRLINGRYCHPDRWTLISSERTLEDIFDIDQALGGRIKERCGPFVHTISRIDQRNYRVYGASH